MEGAVGKVILRFTLTRLQRVFNPKENLATALFGIFFYCTMMVLGGRGLVFTATAIHEGVWVTLRGVLMVVGFLPFISWILWRLFLGAAFRWARMMLFSDQYVNTVVLEGGRVFFGINGVQRELSVGKRVYKGLFGTYIVRCGPCSIVIPKEAIEFDDLKRRAVARASDTT